MRDPSVVMKEGVYYRFTTNGGINIAAASSVVGPWKYTGAALPLESKIQLESLDDTGIIWTPDVIHIKGNESSTLITPSQQIIIVTHKLVWRPTQRWNGGPGQITAALAFQTEIG